MANAEPVGKCQGDAGGTWQETRAASVTSLAPGGVTGPCQRFDGVRVKWGKQWTQNLGLKSPTDSWAPQGPEGGNIAYLLVEALSCRLFPPDPHHALCPEGAQAQCNPFLWPPQALVRMPVMGLALHLPFLFTKLTTAS